MKYKNLLKEEIIRNGFTIKSLSNELKIDVSTFFRKLNKEGAFTILEVSQMFNLLNLSKEKAELIFFGW